MPPYVTGRLVDAGCNLAGQEIAAYAVDASPALAVVHGVVELAPRRPDLVVSGINFGANLGTEVTISGTVGAALEGGAFGIRALAVSLEMDSVYHLTGDAEADYSAAMAATYQFAQQLLTEELPQDVHALNVNVPADATADTPWWVTRLSRLRYFLPLAPDRAKGEGRPGYRVAVEFDEAEPDSDVWAVKVQRVVSVSPISLDLTSRVDMGALDGCLRGEPAACQSLWETRPLPLTRPTPMTVEGLV
jgi:5'-nucleotidase